MEIPLCEVIIERNKIQLLEDVNIANTMVKLQKIEAEEDLLEQGLR